MGLENAVADGVTATKLGTSLDEDRLETLGPPERRLVGGRPEGAAGAIADVAKAAPVVAGTVFPPACDGEVFPATVAPAGVGDHHMVTAVRQ